ncbi:hypothetical protein [Baaleninema simplex]|uniref:hypothetical protein n=1 Tax=Baaleninema simplex TaxID=2862350 RepID=UPI000349156D|nr:hypothetical protein [Baaleninema simplex]
MAIVPVEERSPQLLDFAAVEGGGEKIRDRLVLGGTRLTGVIVSENSTDFRERDRLD